MLLKEALVSSAYFKKILVYQFPREILSKVLDFESIDLIFVAEDLGTKSITEFLPAAKEAPLTAKAAFILVLPEGISDLTEVSAKMVNGFDTQLTAPFSVNRIQEVVDLADRLRQEQTAKRMESTIRILVKNIRSTLAQSSKSFQETGKIPAQIASLREICNGLKRFDSTTTEMFHQHLIETFINIPPPKNNSYRGASERLKKKFEEKQHRNKPTA
jgi:hypothetical protein